MQSKLKLEVNGKKVPYFVECLICLWGLRNKEYHKIVLSFGLDNVKCGFRVRNTGAVDGLQVK